MAKSHALRDLRRNYTESEQFYRAWAAVTRDPSISRRELAHALGLKSAANGQYWIERLESAGVIQVIRTAERATRVLIPFVYVTKNPIVKAIGKRRRKR